MQEYPFQRIKEHLIQLIDTAVYVIKEGTEEEVQKFFFELANLQGYSVMEIQTLEQELERNFPRVFHDFLLHFRKNMTRMPLDPYSCYLTTTTSQKLLSPYELEDTRFTIAPQQLTQENDSWMETLPKTSVIYQHRKEMVVFTADRTEVDNDSIYFYFLRCDEGDDPPVYRWSICLSEDSFQHSLEQYSKRFTEFISKNFDRVRNDYHNFFLLRKSLVLSINNGGIRYISSTTNNQ